MGTELLDHLRQISQLVFKRHGEDFFRQVVRCLGEASGCDYVFVARLSDDGLRSETIAMLDHGELADNISYDLKHTPCDLVSQDRICIHPDGVQDLFPQDDLLKQMHIHAYVGAPLYASSGAVAGVLVALNETPLRDSEHVMTLFEVVANLVAIELERTVQTEEILDLQERDRLTGFGTKAALEKLLDAGSGRSLLIASLNELTTLNSAYGFEETDRIVGVIAEHIAAQFPVDFCARIAPGRFAFLLFDDEEVDRLASRMRDYFLDHEMRTDQVRVYASFSFGGAVGGSDLLRRAATALRVARDRGMHKRIDTAAEQLGGAHRELIEANAILHQALRDDLVVPHFQGIWNNTAHCFDKYEALARIDHDGQVLGPGVFLESARISGHLPHLTRQMIRKTFRVMSGRDEEFAINISEDDLNEGYLWSFLQEHVDAYGLAPERVVLEILEGVSRSAKTANIRQLMAFRDLGFKLAIDDFGAEYSSFERVLDLDVDYVKIDRKFISRIATDPVSRDIVEAIVFFCRKTGIRTIAEHVESQTIQDAVVKLGVDYSQGYHFSRPGLLVPEPRVGS